MNSGLVVCWLVLLSSAGLVVCQTYPITASWFRDRYTAREWNSTLLDFRSIGGDTVWQRAPPLTRRSRADLQRDGNFAWCGSVNSSTGVSGTRCFDEATQDLTALGIKVEAFVTYQYEENFSDSIMLCPKFDRKINSSRIYYRLVLPTTNISDPCNLTSGSSAVVLFTSYAGVDPHQLLVETAGTLNMSVYLGLPAVPMDYDQFGFDAALMPAYYAFVSRVLHDHEVRYSRRNTGTRSLFDAIAGYYSTDESCLAQVDTKSIYLTLYKNLGEIVHKVNKKFAISPFIDLNRAQLNATVGEHVSGLRKIAGTGAVDVVAVQEGRGAGKGCYYWPTQLDSLVWQVDSTLDQIIHYITPSWPHNITYRQAFTASNQELFRQFGEVQDDMREAGSGFEYWLNIEAFEYLRGEPCLPVDPAASGMGELLERTSKGRLDRALTAAGATCSKVISFAWDSDFTCTTGQHKASLRQEILHDAARPIIANCSFHSKENVSVVVIGYNLLDETQGFVVEWRDRDHKLHTDPVNGYYYETDWGEQHGRVASLAYIMMWDIPEMLTALPPVGTVRVQAKGAYHDCVYSYDYS